MLILITYFRDGESQGWEGVVQSIPHNDVVVPATTSPRAVFTSILFCPGMFAGSVLVRALELVSNTTHEAELQYMPLKHIMVAAVSAIESLVWKGGRWFMVQYGNLIVNVYKIPLVLISYKQTSQSCFIHTSGAQPCWRGCEWWWIARPRGASVARLACLHHWAPYGKIDWIVPCNSSCCLHTNVLTASQADNASIGLFIDPTQDLPILVKRVCIS